MSWSVSLAPTAAADFETAVTALTLPESYSSGYAEQDVASAAVADQLAAAKTAAVALFRSGAVGSPTADYFGANLAGHANPGHAPQSGWGNDTISVNVFQADDPANTMEK